MSSQAIALLPDNASPFVKAKYEGQTLHTNSVNDVVKIMQNGMNILGHYEKATEKEVLRLLAENTIKLILSDYKTLTMQELNLAIEKGCNGTYELKKGTLLTLNVGNINFWIKSLYSDETRKIAINYYHALLTAPKNKLEPTPEEKDRLLQKACIDAYEDFKDGKPLTLIPRIVYDYLKKYFEIKWSPEEVIEIKRVAIENYERELKIKKLGREITKNQFEAALDNKKSLELEMKKVALLYYFKKIKNSNQNINFK